ncbi:MAG TPA: SDR family NAD(P)-dependent oxidoreductase [Spongiibacteraceae bacterium]|nr:SDR family NAD(P)-dependent oxidoreductase [Spongiibacteraceae bacterium]
MSPTDSSFARQYGPWALIAGGSEGTGAAFARQLAARGLNLLLVARNSAPLEQVAQQIRTATPVEVRTLSLDLTGEDVVATLQKVTAELEIGLLVYNAGSTTQFSDVLDAPLAYAQRITQLNVGTPLALTHHFAGLMRKRKRGGVILVGSMAGYGGSAGNATYNAAKAYSRILAEGLWYELKPHGVHVLGLILSATNTPAMARIGMVMDNPGFPADDPEVVVQEGLDRLADGPVWVARGREEMAKYMLNLPRAEAVEMMSSAGKVLFPE